MDRGEWGGAGVQHTVFEVNGWDSGQFDWASIWTIVWVALTADSTCALRIMAVLLLFRCVVGSNCQQSRVCHCAPCCCCHVICGHALLACTGTGVLLCQGCGSCGAGALSTPTSLSTRGTSQERVLTCAATDRVRPAHCCRHLTLLACRACLFCLHSQ